MRARYFESADAPRWDEFCSNSYNATFLHTRRFLSYHGNRFEDQSLLLENEGRWLGILPAATHPDDPSIVVSHPGITYGGMVHQGRLRGAEMLDAFRVAAAFWRAKGFERLLYKAIPYIYHLAPAQDDLYALFRLGAVRYRCDLSSCIDLKHRLPVSERRRRGLKKAERAGVEVLTGNEKLPAFWAVLEANLKCKHNAKPVHGLEEIRLLVQRFPESIKCLIGLAGDDIVAGVVLFLCSRVAHAQYIASSFRGQEICALDKVFESTISLAREEGCTFFDFGISSENQGRMLNVGLNQFKSEFGAGGVAYEFYDLDLRRCIDAIE